MEEKRRTRQKTKAMYSMNCETPKKEWEGKKGQRDIYPMLKKAQENKSRNGNLLSKKS